MRTAMRLGFIAALLTGCKTAEKPPEAPGTSKPLAYPVLVLLRNQVRVFDDELALTTTTGASGLNFLEAQIVDSNGDVYRVPKVADFGRKSWILDAGTGHFRLHLTLKLTKRADVNAVRKLVLDIVHEPASTWHGFENGVKSAEEKLGAARDLASLIAACRESWAWR